MAASFTNVSFENGDVTISGTGGSTVSATFRLTVPAGQVVEYVEVDVLGDSLAPVETSVGGTQGLQEGTHDVTLSVKLPPNTGTYTVQVKGAGIYGGLRSINAADGVVAGPTSFSNAVRVVASGSTVVGGDSSMPSWLAALIAALKPTTPTPAPSSACSEYNSLKAGLSVGSDTRPGGSVGKFQSFLMYKGFNIPLLSSNQAPYGYFGQQSLSASNSFALANGCN